MRHHAARSHLALASLVMMALLAVSAGSTVAAEPHRVRSAEKLAVSLVNCLRTGGKVTTNGRCQGRGTGRYSTKRAPFKISRRISNQVALPWATRTVKLNSKRTCWVGHSLARSTVDRRFATVGLKHGANGENIGCASYDPKRMVAFVVRWWQREKAYHGSHWRQIKDKRFKSIGVAVARRGSGKSQLVINFYGRSPR